MDGASFWLENRRLCSMNPSPTRTAGASLGTASYATSSRMYSFTRRIIAARSRRTCARPGTCRPTLTSFTEFAKDWLSNDRPFYLIMGAQGLAAIAVFAFVWFWPGPWNAQRLVGSALLVVGMLFVFIARFQLG